MRCICAHPDSEHNEAGECLHREDRSRPGFDKEGYCARGCMEVGRCPDCGGSGWVSGVGPDDLPAIGPCPRGCPVPAANGETT